MKLLAYACLAAALAVISIPASAQSCSPESKKYSCAYNMGRTNEGKKPAEKKTANQIMAACNCAKGGDPKISGNNACSAGIVDGQQRNAKPRMKLC